MGDSCSGRAFLFLVFLTVMLRTSSRESPFLTRTEKFTPVVFLPQFFLPFSLHRICFLDLFTLLLFFKVCISLRNRF